MRKLAMLNRAGGLERSEMDEIKKHCRESVRMTMKMGYQNQAVLDAVASHHEALSGGGYPEGLSGERIPLGGRILAVAEQYSSLISWRPYRNRWDRRASFAQLEAGAAKGKFDPKAVEALGKVLSLGPASVGI